MAAPDALNDELERLILEELRERWKADNWALFGERMRPPVLALSDATSFLARFVPATRTIEVARQLVIDHPWMEVLEVLKHEMAHQFVAEVLRVSESAHGPVFRGVCQARGIDARAAGVVVTPGDDVATTAAGRVIDKVRRLLALAGSDNPHEADAAMQQARRLMLEHNIRERDTRADERDFTFAHVGPVKARHDEHERVLASILTGHFFVEAIWVNSFRPLEGRRGSVLEICGTPANVRMADYVHGFLLHAGEAAWKRHRTEHGIAGNRDRRSFLVGVMRGFRDKLERERRASTAQGLVWTGDAGVSDYFQRRYPRARTIRRAGRERDAAFAHGQAAGQELVLHRPVEAGRSGGGGLLPSGG
ncbi:MAG: DUF2786 domain-containing protein [Sandaracinaceae bacterium]|nr:DUF2786 domain-containing protein [Myxococcales bacterium]MCB9656028.1 DUF2786 domain-containing protein [Sandaracinaceae bacterium]